MKSFYNEREAAEETGLSISTIKRAITSGDLPTATPTIDGRPIKKNIITHENLTAWMTRTEKVTA